MRKPEQATSLIVFSILAYALPVTAAAGVYECIISEIKNKKEVTLEEAKQNAEEVIRALPEVVGDLSNALADKLESTKVVDKQEDSKDEAVSKDSGFVASKFNDLKNYNDLTATAYNSSVDAVSFLLRHWLWTLAVIGAIALYALFR